MATWINVRKVAKFPEVIRVYKRAGRGQGTGQAVPSYGAGLLQSAPKGFLRTVQVFVQGETLSSAGSSSLPAWIKKDPGSAPGDWQNVKIDVTAIPGVRPLRDNGKWTNYVG